jgi:hypothetical protein
MNNIARDGYLNEVDKLIKRHRANTANDRATALLIREDAISLAKSALANSESQISRLQKVTLSPRSHNESPEYALENGLKNLEIRLENLRYEIGIELSPVLQKPDEVTFRWLINHLNIRQWIAGFLILLGAFYFGITLSDTSLGMWVKKHTSWANLP